MSAAEPTNQPSPIRPDAECGFCHGRPVVNAEAWADGKPRPPAQCPRCGRTADVAAGEQAA